MSKSKRAKKLNVQNARSRLDSAKKLFFVFNEFGKSDRGNSEKTLLSQYVMSSSFNITHVVIWT